MFILYENIKTDVREIWWFEQPSCSTDAQNFVISSCVLPYFTKLLHTAVTYSNLRSWILMWFKVTEYLQVRRSIFFCISVKRNLFLVPYTGCTRFNQFVFSSYFKNNFSSKRINGDCNDKKKRFKSANRSGPILQVRTKTIVTGII